VPQDEKNRLFEKGERRSGGKDLDLIIIKRHLGKHIKGVFDMLLDKEVNLTPGGAI
jgi:hypothetical protein